MIDTVWGTTTKPESSKKLALILNQIPDLSGTLYIGYPIIGTPEGAFPFDALLLSPEKGLISFAVIEGKSLGDYKSALDESFTKLQAKLLQYSSLSKGRRLNVLITTIAFAPIVPGRLPDSDDDFIVADASTLEDEIKSIEWTSPELYPPLAAALQAISSIRKGRKRKETLKINSLGARMKVVDDSIANLDSQQSAAVIETVEGVQRIRGLAGSGKTIVLALKVAYLHAKHPDWKIAVTFNTRSLKGQFERLINTFVIEQTNEEPDWSQIDIINAWGAPGGKQRDGIYYKYCIEAGAEYLDFRSADTLFGANKSFEGVCEKALKETKGDTPFYDAILVDEAQDFSPAFLQLCYRFLKPPKRLVYAYDELQSLTDNSLSPPEQLFGNSINGSPIVTFGPVRPGQPRQDIILEKCYRNSRPLLATAHALGFGIYREPEGLIQLFDQKELWLDVGYSIDAGALLDNNFVSLTRTDRTSPIFLESHSTIDELIQFEAFESVDEQNAWLVENIEKNILQDELNPEDILVINPDPLKTRDAVAKPRADLLRKQINSSLAGVTSSVDIFSVEDSVTFTGIFRAKGNEAAMVYVINSQDCYSSYLPGNLAKARNRLFTSITRSKAWVRVIGVGEPMKKLIAEYQKVKDANFKLQFKYPDDEARRKLRIINRELSKSEREAVKKGLGDISNLIRALENGELVAEDLPTDIVDRLLGAIKSGQAK